MYFKMIALCGLLSDHTINHTECDAIRNAVRDPISIVDSANKNGLFIAPHVAVTVGFLTGSAVLKRREAIRAARDQGHVLPEQIVIQANVESLRDVALRALIVDNLIVTNSIVFPGSSCYRQCTSLDVPDTLVLRDAQGSFSATDIISEGVLGLPSTTQTTGQLLINEIPVLHTYGDNNLFIGPFAGNFYTVGLNNVACGPSALQDNDFGESNIGIGPNALRNNVDGSVNIGLGEDSLFYNTTGSRNIAIGYQSAYAVNGTDNIIIGAYAGSNYEGGESNNICIGDPGQADDNGTCRIAHIYGVSSVGRGNAVVINESNQLGTIGSSRRYKTNIQDLDKQRADAILAVRPVTFNYLTKYNQPCDDISMGLIAEEVAAVNPEWVVYDDDNLPMTVRYHELLIPVIKQMQNVVSCLATVVNKVALLEQENAALKEALQKVDAFPVVY